MSHNTTDANAVPAARKRSTYDPISELHSLPGITPADPQVIRPTLNNSDGDTLSPLMTTAAASSEKMHPQSSSRLFKLPPELRNQIYAYAFDRRDDSCDWDAEHDCPKINLLDAKHTAPSNELLRTSRRINAESKGIFAGSQQDFWRKSTFIIKIEKSDLDSPSFASRLDDLSNAQIDSMARITISIGTRAPHEVRLTPDPESDSASWTIESSTNTHTFRPPIAYALMMMSRLLFTPQHLETNRRDGDCVATYARIKSKVSRVIADVSDPNSRGGRNLDRTVTVACEACGGGELVYHAMPHTRRLELMVCAAFICETAGLTR